MSARREIGMAPGEQAPPPARHQRDRPGALGPAQTADQPAAQPDMAGIGIGKPRQRTQQQALASAGGTENHRNLARRQHRIHALEPAMLAMAEGQIVDAELHSPP